MPTKNKPKKIRKGTVRYEVEKVRLSIVRILLHAIKDRIITRNELRQIAKDVLEITDTVSKHAQIDEALAQIAKKYPLLMGVKVERATTKK